jgi:hypothetical protein
MRVGFLSIALVAPAVMMACGGSHKRPPLEEVPLEMPKENSGDVLSAPMPTTATQTTPRPRNVAADAKALLKRGDAAGARALLEPRVADPSATSEEKQLLRQACKAMHDAQCLARIK